MQVDLLFPYAPTLNSQARARSTRRPVAGASVFVLATFFPAALTPMPFLAGALAAGGAFAFVFTMVVPVDTAEVLLLLLTVRFSAVAGPVGAALLGRAADALGSITGFDALRPIAATVRPGFDFSPTIFASVVVAARATDLAGDTILIGDTGFNGEVGRERYGF